MICLVVDDSKSARFTISRVLKKLGHSVLTAENGENALEVLCSETPDVVFMDHLMPGLDGFETSKKIRSQPNFSELPIIMCTAKDSESYTKEAKSIGLTGTLPKPATEEQIQNILNNINKSFENNLNENPAENDSVIDKDNDINIDESNFNNISNSALNLPDNDFNESDFASAAAKPDTLNSKIPFLEKQALKPVQKPQPAYSITNNSSGSGRQEIELNDQLRTLIRAEAEGRARDSAQRLLTDSWGRFRGNLQEDVRQQTKQLVEVHMEDALEIMTNQIKQSINTALTTDLRNYVDKKLNASQMKEQLNQSEFSIKLNGLKRQLEMQKFDPVALQDTILEDARRAAEYTATHKAVDIASKIARELCEDTISELLDTSVLENFEEQLVKMNVQLEIQTQKSRMLTMVAAFASVLAALSFGVAIWALV